MLKKIYRHLLIILCISAGLFSSFSMEKKDIPVGDAWPIVLSQRDDHTLSTLSITSKSLALETEKEFTRRSPIKNPLPLMFSKEKNDSVWQPAKHSYFLRGGLESALNDLRKNPRMYGDMTLEDYGDTNLRQEQMAVRKRREKFPEYCQKHGFSVGKTFYEILLDDSDSDSIETKVQGFSQLLARGVHNRDPICLEFQWALKCYLVNQSDKLCINDLIKTLFLCKFPADYVNLSHKLHFKNLGEIKSYYAKKLGANHLKELRDSYIRGIDYEHARIIETEVGTKDYAKYVENKRYLTLESETYFNLFKQRQIEDQQKEDSHHRKIAESYFNYGKSGVKDDYVTFPIQTDNFKDKKVWDSILCFKVAADLGYAESQEALAAILLEEGNKYLKLAAENGNAVAKQ